jgi:hypothetical protein
MVEEFPSRLLLEDLGAAPSSLTRHPEQREGSLYFACSVYEPSGDARTITPKSVEDTSSTLSRTWETQLQQKTTDAQCRRVSSNALTLK